MHLRTHRAMRRAGTFALMGLKPSRQTPSSCLPSTLKADLKVLKVLGDTQATSSLCFLHEGCSAAKLQREFPTNRWRWRGCTKPCAYTGLC